MQIKKIISTILIVFAASSAHANLVEGTDYTKLPKEIPQTQAKKIEVLEFFGYFCIHCRHLEPILSKHIKTFASDTYFRQSHVVWRPEDINLARINAAAQASHTSDSANPAVFKALFDDNINLSNIDTFKQWAETQKTWNIKALLQAFNSPTNIAAANKMKQETSQYQISSTPVIIVGGKYQFNRINPTTDMQRLDQLINQVRKERNMPYPSKKTIVKSSGAGLALQAK